MEIDRNGLEVLDVASCHELLSSATIGRVGLCRGALPTVLPVNFLLTDDGVVFRTGRGSKLEAATHGTVVAFEVDDIDPMTHSGWSVVVTGMAREMSDLDELERLRRLPIAYWGGGEADRYVVISLDIVTGRRIPEVGGAMRVVRSGPAEAEAGGPAPATLSASPTAPAT